MRVEHDDRTLIVHLSDEDGGGWTVLAVDRATRRYVVAQARRQVDAAQDAHGGCMGTRRRAAAWVCRSSCRGAKD